MDEEKSRNETADRMVADISKFEAGDQVIMLLRMREAIMNSFKVQIEKSVKYSEHLKQCLNQVMAGELKP